MTSPNPKRQKEAFNLIDALTKDAENVSVIHYFCESFYDRPNGASPRITSIAVRKLDTGQTLSFSIHQVAEREGIAFDDEDGVVIQRPRHARHEGRDGAFAVPLAGWSATLACDSMLPDGQISDFAVEPLPQRTIPVGGLR
jgi:hypothetical protein